MAGSWETSKVRQARMLALREREQALAYIKQRGAGTPGGGARTFHVAQHLGIATSRARRRLLELEAAGKIRRSARYSAINDIFWETIP